MTNLCTTRKVHRKNNDFCLYSDLCTHIHTHVYAWCWLHSYEQNNTDWNIKLYGLQNEKKKIFFFSWEKIKTKTFFEYRAVTCFGLFSSIKRQLFSTNTYTRICQFLVGAWNFLFSYFPSFFTLFKK